MAEDEQIQGRAALKDPSSLERRVPVQSVQQIHQTENFLDHLRVESVGSGHGKDLRGGKSHHTSPQD